MKIVLKTSASLYSRTASLLPEEGLSFDIDNIRVCKILGGNIMDSRVVRGMVFKREAEGLITRRSDAKIVCYSCPLDISQTETKGTVLIEDAEQLLSYSNKEDTILGDVCILHDI